MKTEWFLAKRYLSGAGQAYLFIGVIACCGWRRRAALIILSP